MRSGVGVEQKDTLGKGTTKATAVTNSGRGRGRGSEPVSWGQVMLITCLGDKPCARDFICILGGPSQLCEIWKPSQVDTQDPSMSRVGSFRGPALSSGLQGWL